MSDKQIIRAFQTAKRRIKNESETFICHALPISKIGDQARRIVGRSIGRHSTMNHWMQEQMGGVMPRFNEVREVRLRFIDSTIKALRERNAP